MSDMFDTDSPDFDVERIYEASDFMGKDAKENPPSFDCVFCGAMFFSQRLRDLHLLTDHDDEAA